MTIESHPLTPFLPINARILFLGSFPPPKQRWSMEFFYPNFNNDFWRLMGLIHFNNKDHFVIQDKKTFDYDSIVRFATENGLAFFDTATQVCRLRDNASDEFLQIIKSTDVKELLNKIPSCRIIVTTGGKASTELKNILALDSVPKVGESQQITIENNWNGTWFRMPSSSRAYPMKLEKKAEFYASLFK